jgi:hypothetical protein
MRCEISKYLFLILFFSSGNVFGNTDERMWIPGDE